MECIQNGKHIYICELSEHISNDILADLKKSMRKHKPKKKKKGKKGKKGKKKWVNFYFNKLINDLLNSNKKK